MKNIPITSVISLVLANASVLYFAGAGEHGVFSVVLLYWAESVIIGFYVVLKTLFHGDELDTFPKSAPGALFSGMFFRIFPVLFFCAHFGGFMFAHFLVITALLPEEMKFSTGNVDLLSTFLIPFLALFASHTISFITNYIGKREYRANVGSAGWGTGPYGRIILMQLTLIFGLMLSGAVGHSYMLVVVMVALKTIVDLHAHIKEHGRIA